MIKNAFTFILTTALIAVALSSFIGFDRARQIRLQSTYVVSDTLPKVKLPEGTNPEDPDWKGIDLAPEEPYK